jgi:hypothetical protein
MNRSKRLGTTAEVAVVEYLRQWWPGAERRALAGTKDRGDVAGIPSTVCEVKNEKAITLAAYMAELEAEMANEAAHTGTTPTGVVIVKRRGVGDVSKWYAVMPVAEWVALRRGER